MEIEKSELLQDVIISYYKRKNQFYSQAELNVDGYAIKLNAEYFDTLEEAVTSIKNRISIAVIKFK